MTGDEKFLFLGRGGTFSIIMDGGSHQGTSDWGTWTGCSIFFTTITRLFEVFSNVFNFRSNAIFCYDVLNLFSFFCRVTFNEKISDFFVLILYVFPVDSFLFLLTFIGHATPQQKFHLAVGPSKFRCTFLWSHLKNTTKNYPKVKGLKELCSYTFCRIFI